MTTPKSELPSPLDEAHGSATSRNLAWAERELMKMQDEESDPKLRALWSTAARIARERIAHEELNHPHIASSTAEADAMERDADAIIHAVEPYRLKAIQKPSVVPSELWPNTQAQRPPTPD